MSLVAPGLYVGDETAATSEAWLRHHSVTAVLNCTNKPHPSLEALSSGSGTNAPAGGSNPIRYLRLNLLDSTSDLPRMQSVLREGVDFIRAALKDGGCVLVHCHRGISRSCTLAMAYLIEEEQRSADIIFESLRSKRRVADPNLGYWCAIQEWEKHVLPPRLVRARSSSSIPRSSPHPLATASPRPLSRAG